MGKRVAKAYERKEREKGDKRREREGGSHLGEQLRTGRNPI